MANSAKWFAGIANRQKKKKAHNRRRRKEAKRHKQWLRRRY